MVRVALVVALAGLVWGLPVLANDSIIGPSPAPDSSVRWRPLLGQAALFAGLQHGFRIATEPGTRQGLRGAFLPGYFESVRNLRGWSDGDPFYVNYVGHPMQGSIASFLFIQNDPRYRNTEIGREPNYWKSRLRALAFSWAYSTQFEIGPLSEASIGKIQGKYPQTGFVDHVITPALGFGWTLAEDALDRYVIGWLERRVENPWVNLMARGWLNPSRSFANILRGQAPWFRDTRTGIFAGRQRVPDAYRAAERSPRTATPGLGESSFEFAFTQRTILLTDGRTPGSGYCLGGGGVASVRLSKSWELVADAAGCKLVESEPGRNGDQISYLAGPRWTPAPGGRWSPHLQFLAGGTRVTHEHMYAERLQRLELAAREASAPAPMREEYVAIEDANGFTLSAGGGLDLRLHRAIALRLASLEYRRAWLPRVDGASYRHGLQFSAGLVLRAGTW